MSQLKPSFVKEIYLKLKSSLFSVNDFEIDLPQKGKILINITFKYKSDYKFVVSEEALVYFQEVSDDYQSLSRQAKTERQPLTALVVNESPGDYKLNERMEVQDFGEAINKISKWCNNIHEDFCAKIEEGDNYSHLRIWLDEIIIENGEDENRRFCKSMVKDLMCKLDNLYSKFEVLNCNNYWSEDELKSIKTYLDQAVLNAERYPRGLWKRITNNKLIQIVADVECSNEDRDLIVDGIKNLFLQ